MADFTIKQNDTRPYFAVTFDECGTVVSLVGATVFFNMRPVLGGSLKIDARPCVVTGAATGKAEYRWAVGDTDTVGKFDSEFEIHLAGGGIMTAPAIGYLIVEIVEELGSATTTAPPTTTP